jgi:hypothetical protein
MVPVAASDCARICGTMTARSSISSHVLTVARASAAVTMALMVATPAAAQTEERIRSVFEGRRVTVKIDMPATSSGVDLEVEAPRPMDYKQYGDRIRSTGVAIRAGDSTVVTLVKVKKDLIEFQLGGGGYSAGGSSVYIPNVEKSNREKDLEKAIKAETDSAKRRAMQRELDDLEAQRSRENARVGRERARLEEENKARIAMERLDAGSRFNLRYRRSIPEGLTADDVRAALSEFVEFDAPGRAPVAAAVRPATPPRSDLPRKGMLRADAEREFGTPVQSTSRREGTLSVSTLVFVRGEQRITAEFVEGVLFRYSVSSR